MSTFPGSPKLVQGGIVLLDSDSGKVVRVIPFQYNPESLTRTLQPQQIGDTGDVAEATRLKGPPVETFKVEVEFDATDQAEPTIKNSDVATLGVQPALAAIESIVYPKSSQIDDNDMLASFGTLEIASAMAPLVLFVFGSSRIVPVKLTELSVTEEMHSPELVPIRAKVSLGMRVLSVNDLPSGHKGASLYMTYHRNKEKLAGKVGGSLENLGLKGSI